LDQFAKTGKEVTKRDVDGFFEELQNKRQRLQ